MQKINDGKEGNEGEASITRELLGPIHMSQNGRNRLGNIRTITITATTLTYLVANIEGGNVYVILTADITGGECREEC